MKCRCNCEGVHMFRYVSINSSWRLVVKKRTIIGTISFLVSTRQLVSIFCVCVSNTIALRAVWFLSTRFLLHFFLVASQLAGNNVTDNEFEHMDRDMLISSTLRSMQTDATLLANNTQHCWAQHVASDCMEPQQCWHLLHKV